MQVPIDLFVKPHAKYVNRALGEGIKYKCRKMWRIFRLSFSAMWSSIQIAPVWTIHTRGRWLREGRGALVEHLTASPVTQASWVRTPLILYLGLSPLVIFAVGLDLFHSLESRIPRGLSYSVKVEFLGVYPILWNVVTSPETLLIATRWK